MDGVQVKMLVGPKYPYGKRVEQGDTVELDRVTAKEWERMGWVSLKKETGKTSPDKTASKSPSKER